MARFVNPTNGYSEGTGFAWLWTLLFGPFYLAVKGLWGHALVLVFFPVALGLATGGPGIILGFPLLLVYVLMVGGILERSYLRKGWVTAQQYERGATAAAAPAPTVATRPSNSIRPPDAGY